MFDIHSHILPAVDDGAKNMEEALSLLEMEKEQGVKAVMLTPHFYPHEDNLTDFKHLVNDSFEALRSSVALRDLPDIYLGCEILYFKDMGYAQSLVDLTLAESQFLLIELTDQCIGEALFKDIDLIENNLLLTPIIAHVERYCASNNYRKFIKFLKKKDIMVQINASAFFEPLFQKAISKLMKEDIKILIGSDAHSFEERPPMIDKAILKIKREYGQPICDKILRNMDSVYKKIISNGEAYAY